MADQTPPPAAPPAPPPAPPAPPAPNPGDPSINAQAKQLAWVKSLQQDSARLKALEADVAAKESSAAEAARLEQIKLAEGEKRYEDAMKLKDAEAQTKIDALEKKVLKAELSTALLGKGSKNSDGFFKVAMAEYDSTKHASIDAYAESLKTNETYAGFFGESQAPPTPPGKLPATGGTGTLTNEQIKALKKSDKQEERSKAIRYLEDWWDKNGSLPPGYVSGG
jgi:hypothetical protein